MEIDRQELRNTLNGLQQSTEVEEESFEDFNLISMSNPNRLKLYVRHFELFQVVHTLSDSDAVSLDVKQDKEMVFNSDVLTSLIKNSKSERLNIRFYEDKFSVEARDSWFSTPTTFTLNLFQEDEFQSILSLSDFETLASIDRRELVENLEMMSIVSNVVQLKLTSDEFWISVSDAVHGEGKVMEAVNRDEISLNDFEQKYRIDIIESFLGSFNTDFVNVQMNENQVLRLTAEDGGHTAELTLAPRVR
ncbi:hypothetical protein [Halosimplex sp. TS25]|uniref:hypothetical protein n=1 Tax=Halosimplex rarum TaxID=3396619 RepID=UPI0039EB6067